MGGDTYQPETRIVAFLDVLGFKEQTRRCLQDPALLKALDRSLARTDMLTEPYLGYQTDTRMFSDCICSSSPFRPDNIFKFIYTIEAVQMNLACAGVFVRGGIAIGRHFENHRMIVSEGLIEAYLLESKEAIVPRIVVSGATLLRLAEALRGAGRDDWDGGSTSIASNLNAHVRRDHDGRRFVSYLMSLRRIDRSSIIDEYIFDHKRAVEAWLSQGRDTKAPTSVRQKHEWVRDYHNAMIQELFPTGCIDDNLIDAP